ncbi:hypothetical protein I545_6833 [Mycobacterium kansasii 662]|uniref:Uncharacterized protein n=1 Tax=Mycobacterium kansasii 662 TaxID=1299326 RepID=X7XQS6_MYCKA|nr:hypothetical protein I545_6833 [Mycobacterium kansasii 662]
MLISHRHGDHTDGIDKLVEADRGTGTRGESAIPAWRRVTLSDGK